MTQQLAVFNFHGSQVRTVEQCGDLWFIGKDVAEVLGYADTDQAIRQHCKRTELLKPVKSAPFEIPPRGYIIIPESDVYRLVMRSNLPSAERFEEWVTGEVLPSIRKTGSYSMQPQELIARAVIEAQKLIDHQTALIAEMQPKADFFDTVTGSSDAVDIGTVAKVLNCGIGRTRLFSFLRDCSILQDNNQPYQRYIDAGYFRVIESTYNKPDGSTHVNFKTVVYQKGIAYIRKRLAKSIESGEFKEAA